MLLRCSFAFVLPIVEYCSRVWGSAAECHHRVDSVIESSLREIILSKNFALINLSVNFCKMTIYDKVFLENLVAVH